MINIVMTVKDRPRLTAQALRTLALNTSGDWRLVIVDDQSADETCRGLDFFRRLRPKQVAILRNHTSKGIVGQAKNLGVYWAERYWGRGEWLALSDNDVFFTPGWDEALTHTLTVSERREWGYLLIGGQNHPYHQPVAFEWLHADTKQDTRKLQEYQALAGTSWLMRWDTWDRFGPLDATTPGVCMGEDWTFTERTRAAGGRIGALDPPVVIDCSLTQTDGKPAIGVETKTKRVEGVLYL